MRNGKAKLIFKLLLGLCFSLAHFCLPVFAEEITAVIPVSSNTKTAIKIDAVTPNAPLPASSTVNLNTEGSISISYTTVGTYEYNVYQLKTEGITIDETVYRVEVYVTTDTDGKLKISIVAKNNKTGEKPDKIYFNNKTECVGCTPYEGRTITEAPTGVEKSNATHFYIILTVGIISIVVARRLRKKILYIIPAILIIAGATGILLPVIKYETQAKATENEIQTFLDKTAENNDSKNFEEQFEPLEGDIKGVIEIESINLKAPIANGTDTETLTKYVGKYSELEDFGETSGVVGLASHSTRFAEPCSYCYFQDIGELQEGDIIKITWNDGNLYQYVVYNVEEWKQQNTPGEFEPVEGKEILVLQTCTNGQRGTRTYVHAERKA